MARIKVAYIGGGSTRAPGTVASFVQQGENFAGSELVLIDLDAERLKVVETIGRKLAHARNLDLQITATTDRRSGLRDCDAVLTSYRPGGFEARYLDESIPLKHGVIGQETQGPGGFFMALRTINVMKDIIADMEAVCPRARLFNYTNPVNIVSEAVVHHSAIPTISFCEGPIMDARWYAEFAGLDPDKLDAPFIGLNHGSWSFRQLYDGQEFMPLLLQAYERALSAGKIARKDLRMVELACWMGALPNDYFRYYYFKEEILAELQAKPTTRAQDIMAQVEDYWTHYREQAAREVPVLDPARSRGGINELELAIDAMDAIYNDRREWLYINVPNQGALEDFPANLVVELPGYLDHNGAVPSGEYGRLPRPVRGLVQMLGEYQALAAEAAWNGTRRDAVRALASHPLVFSLHKAEAIYNELAAAQRDYLPARLLHN
jgi:6-phospho-beta-glucosidase